VKLPDGQEAVVKLEYPLSMSVASAVMKAVSEKLEELGWTEVVLLLDGTDRIAGTPPGVTRKRPGG